METVRLLDSYRLALARDAKGVRLLAFLQKDGAQLDYLLAAKTRLPLHDVRSKLTELFRANFVRLLDDGRYAPTEIAEQVLANLGVADVVASDAVSTSGLPDQDKVFLKSFLADRESAPSSWRRYFAAAAQSAKQLESEAKIDAVDWARLFYGVLAGLDPASRELGADISCRHAFTHANFGVSGVKANLEHFAQQCEQAIRDRAASNEFFSTGRRAEASTTSSITLALTFVRLWASVLSQHADEGLVAAAMTTGINDSARAALKEWAAPFEQRYLEAIYHRLSQPVSVRSNLIDALCFEVGSSTVPWRVSLSSQARVRVGVDTIVDRLNIVEEQLRAGTVTREEQQRALPIINRIHTSLEIGVATKAPLPTKR